MLQEMQVYLAGKFPALTVKYGYMPKDPVEVLVLYGYAGRPPEYTLAGGRTARPGLQLVARSMTYAAAHGRLKSAQAELEAVINATVGSSFYRRIEPVQEPFPMPGWQEGTVVLAQNYAVEVEEA